MTTVIVIILGICAGIIAGSLRVNHNLKEAENKFKEMREEIDWWQDQCKVIADERMQFKRKYNEELSKYNALKFKYEKLDESFNAYIRGYKDSFRTIADKNEELIRELYEEGLSYVDIARQIGCGRSTIGRAIQKWGLSR